MVCHFHVDLVLSGHTHVPVSRSLAVAAGHRLAVVVAGTATSTRVRGVPRSYNVIRVEDRQIRVVRRVEVSGAWQAGDTDVHTR